MLKATRTGVVALTDHIFSMVVFVVYLVEFLVVREAATSVFFILMAIALIDVIAGFSITISGARRGRQLRPWRRPSLTAGTPFVSYRRFRR